MATPTTPRADDDIDLIRAKIAMMYSTLYKNLDDLKEFEAKLDAKLKLLQNQSYNPESPYDDLQPGVRDFQMYEDMMQESREVQIEDSFNRFLGKAENEYFDAFVTQQEQVVHLASGYEETVIDLAGLKTGPDIGLRGAIEHLHRIKDKLALVTKLEQERAQPTLNQNKTQLDTIVEQLKSAQQELIEYREKRYNGILGFFKRVADAFSRTISKPEEELRDILQEAQGQNNYIALGERKVLRASWITHNVENLQERKDAVLNKVKKITNKQEEVTRPRFN